MQAKVLFYGTPGTTEGDLTSGPGAGKTWLCRSIWLCNNESGAKKVTLKHYINATDTITLLKEHTIDASDTKILGPFIIQNGQKIVASQETAGAIQVIAYGLEETIS
jgi:broad-specificity NMP kinase